MDVAVAMFYQGTDLTVKNDLDTYFSVVFLKTSSKWV
jgi:hypothetical protein